MGTHVPQVHMMSKTTWGLVFLTLSLYKLKSEALAASALTIWAVSPAPILTTYKFTLIYFTNDNTYKYK